MKIGILLFTRSIRECMNLPPGSNRIHEAALAKGHEVHFLYEPLFEFGFGLSLSPLSKEGSKGGSVRYDGSPLGEFDVIVARPAIVDEPSLHTVTADILKRAGYIVVNGMPTFSVSKNKLAQAMRLDEAKIAQPKSIIVRHPKNARAAAEELDYPVVIKMAFGTHGKGVFLAKDSETMQSIVDYLLVRDRNPVILQEFIAESRGKDLRALVVNNKVVAAMQRISQSNDFRANAHLDGVGEAVELSAEETELATDAAKAFELEIAGVDMIRSNRGTLVLEVNSNPGFEELEKATNIDVASKIVDFLESVDL